MTLPRRSFVALCASLALPAWSADVWPSKPIVYVVPFAAGGTTDNMARLIAQKLGPALGTTITVENRAGAGGSIGAEYVSRAAPDGYTIVGGSISSHAMNVSLYPNIGYDPVKSFEPIVFVGNTTEALVVNPKSSYMSLADIIAAGKAGKPLTGATSGSGFSLELLKLKAGIDITRVPYKGNGPAMQDVMAGQVDMMFVTTVVAAPNIEAGRLRALAVTSPQRLPTMPNLPTVAEAGVPGFEVSSWQAIFAPAGTPNAIAERLHVEIEKILHEPDMEDHMVKLGIQGEDMTRAQITEFQKGEVAKWAAVIKSGNIKLE
jgi:tripartite-type tricarboxylate transporter receptor subunit TctC